MTDPYDHVREAFHGVAKAAMDWNAPPERAERRGDGLRGGQASYRTSDISTLEKAAESLARQGDFTNAVALWALALRVRHDA